MKKIFILVLGILPLSLLSEETPNSYDEQWGIGAQFGNTSTKSKNSSDDLDYFFHGGLQLEYRKTENLSYKLGSFAGDDSFLNLFSNIFGDNTEYSFRTTYLTASARTSSPLYVFGGLGVGYTSEKIIDGNDFATSEKSLNLMLEAGAGWDISEHFSMNITYMLTNAEYAEIKSGHVTVQYRF